MTIPQPTALDRRRARRGPHARRPDARPCAGTLPDAKADHARRPVRSGRRQRHPGASACAAPVADPQPDRHRRQQAGRGRQHRRRHGGARAGRRLHAADRIQPDHDQSGDRHQDTVQRRARLRAGRADRVGADRAGVQPEQPFKTLPEFFAVREAQPRQAHVQQPGQRHAAASGRRSVRAADEDADRAHPVQGHRARDLRSSWAARCRFRSARWPR